MDAETKTRTTESMWIVSDHTACPTVYAFVTAPVKVIWIRHDGKVVNEQWVFYE